MQHSSQISGSISKKSQGKFLEDMYGKIFDEESQPKAGEKEELQPMRTVIGEIRGNYDGVYRDFTVYYGNALSPVLNSQILHLSRDKYLDMLDEFLKSDDGRRYRKPEDWQIDVDIQKVISEERQIELKREIDLVKESEEEFKAKVESIHSSLGYVEEMKKSVDGLETSINASLKKQRIVLTAMAAMMALLAALCMFLALPELSALIPR